MPHERQARKATRVGEGAGDVESLVLDGPATGAVDDFRRSYRKDRGQLLRRLARIEGQVRGIARMIERDEYCVDILQQTSALRAAVDSLALVVMEDHVAGCLQTAVRTGNATAYTEEVMDVVRRSLGRPVRASRAAADESRPSPEHAATHD